MRFPFVEFIIHTVRCNKRRRGDTLFVAFVLAPCFSVSLVLEQKEGKRKKGRRRRRNVAAVVGENWGVVVLHAQSRLTQLRVGVCLGIAVRRSQCDLMRCRMNNTLLFRVISYPAILTFAGMQKKILPEDCNHETMFVFYWIYGPNLVCCKEEKKWLACKLCGARFKTQVSCSLRPWIFN